MGFSKKAAGDTLPVTAPSPAATAPVPQIEVTPKPAPGKQGPAGTGIRTNYSRVNTGTVPAPDAGADQQKSLLPKYGSTMNGQAARPTLQDMLKAAMDGTMSRVRISEEARRFQGNLGEKTAEAAPPQHQEKVSSAYVGQLANALDYLSQEFNKEASTAPPAHITENIQAPGKGPGALEVTQAVASKSLPDHKGQGTQVVPMHPGSEKVHAPEHGQTAAETNMDSPPGGNAKAPMTNYGKQASAEDLFAANLERLGLGKEAAGSWSAPGQGGSSGFMSMRSGPTKSQKLVSEIGQIQGPAGHAREILKQHAPVKPSAPVSAAQLESAGAKMRSGTLRGAAETAASKLKGLGEKAKGLFSGVGSGVGKLVHASVDDVYLANLERLGIKLAEDAINPAQISAGPAIPPDTSAAGQPGGSPAGGAPMGPSGLVGSNQAAIAYTRGQSYANRKEDLKKYFTEPALSAAHDNTLQVAFDNTSAAGPKVASAMSKTAAALPPPTVIAAGERGLGELLLGRGMTRMAPAVEHARVVQEAAKGIENLAPHEQAMVEAAKNQLAQHTKEQAKTWGARAALGTGMVGAGAAGGYALGHGGAAPQEGMPQAMPGAGDIKTAAARALLENLVAEVQAARSA